VRCRRTHWLEPSHLHTVLNIDTRVYLFTIPCRLFNVLLHGQPPELKHIPLHRVAPRTEVYNYTGQLLGRKCCTSYPGHYLGPKPTTIWDKSRDRNAALALGKNSPCENLHSVSHNCKSSLGAMTRNAVYDTYVTPNRILVFAVIGW
jgi:hypothetical protein